MDAYRCIVSKREVRSFLPREVPEETIRRILKAGRWSGSSVNRQPWHFVVVRDRERLAALSRFGRFSGHVAGAAFAVALVARSSRDLFDAGRCAQNMMLAGWSEGIGSCPATIQDQDGARAFLGIPEDRTLVTVLSFGYPDPRASHPIERVVRRVIVGRGRRPLESMVSWEAFGR
ncbi:MAG: nitroreductase family protein [Armatimonadetes bacterium]|nr:nitroreductase family protein [Armatimonadota bacterium]